MAAADGGRGCTLGLRRAAVFGEVPGFSDSFPLLGDRFLLRSTKLFETHRHGVPEKLVFAGPLLWEPRARDGSVEEWCDEARAAGAGIVYLNIDKLFQNRDFVEDVLDAADGLGLRVAAALGTLAAAHPRQGRHVLIPSLPSTVCRAGECSTRGLDGTHERRAGGGLRGGSAIHRQSGEWRHRATQELCHRAGVGLGKRIGDVTRETLTVVFKWMCEEAMLRDRAADLASAFAASASFS